jgi:small-conductance mechanosensitive channel
MRHSDQVRIQIPLVVAHGTDTELLRGLLLDIALGHEAVVKDGEPPARVLFKSWAPNQLAFELDCTIRDGSVRDEVVSDLLFAIERAFREHAIQRPGG